MGRPSDPSDLPLAIPFNATKHSSGPKGPSQRSAWVWGRAKETLPKKEWVPWIGSFSSKQGRVNDHSIKNIPLPSVKDYNRALIEKTELLCKRMRWKAFFFLNPNVGINKKETFGFTSKKTPPQITEILNFEKRLLQMIANIRFRKVNCSFRRKFSSDIQNSIMKSTN